MTRQTFLLREAHTSRIFVFYYFWRVYNVFTGDKNKMGFASIDTKIMNFFRRIAMPIARFSLFLVFFWFGILKVLGLSPASGLVRDLFYRTIPIMDFNTFLIAFGIFECLIGILFLIKGMERLAVFLLFLHLITTLGPLFLCGEAMWTGFMTPTMEGQYIIKNIVILAVALGIITNPHNA